MNENLIYLDNNATTKIDPRVLEAMMPFLTNEYGNAASNHKFGTKINQYIKEARANIAELIGCDDNEIIFTSGATEAINLAIKGVAECYADKGKHIVTVITEHPAVLDTCKYLEKKGYKITYLPVETDGLLNIDLVKESIKEDTILISVMLVNNETGIIQPIQEIAKIAHSKGVLFMTDATQAVGKMSIDVNDIGIDLMSFSGHKFYGPKGIGALYVRSKRPNKVKLIPLLHGGGHESTYRSGTLNVPGIIGLGKATVLARVEMEMDAQKVIRLRDYMESELLKIDNTSVNGNTKQRLYNISNICFKGADADAMIIDLSNILVSNGSACSSTLVEPSHVLTAMGLSPADCYSSIRFSLGKFNTQSEIDIAIEAVKETVVRLRSLNTN